MRWTLVKAVEVLAFLIAGVILACIVCRVANAPSLPPSGTGLNPCGTTPHCPTWNDNNN